MKKLLLSLCVAGSLSVSAQITIFEDSFEEYPDFAIANVGAWTLTDVDMSRVYGFTGVTFANSGVPKSFQVFNSTTTTDPLQPTAESDWSARTGVKNMVCFAAVVPTNNDYLISPPITLGSAGNLLSFWAKSCDATYGDEEFTVLISTTGTAVADFEDLPGLFGVLTPSDATYYEYTANLDQYAGQQVYIAIQCTSDDQFGFAVDDFKVTATALSTQSFFASNFSVYPNPTSNVINLNSASALINNVTLTDINGRTVKTLALGGVSQSQINLADLTTGVYFLSVESNLGTGVSKIVKN